MFALIPRSLVAPGFRGCGVPQVEAVSAVARHRVLFVHAPRLVHHDTMPTIIRHLVTPQQKKFSVLVHLLCSTFSKYPYPVSFTEQMY